MATNNKESNQPQIPPQAGKTEKIGQIKNSEIVEDDNGRQYHIDLAPNEVVDLPC